MVRRRARRRLFVTIGLDSEYEEKAAFGTITYYFTEQFDVAAGVRYSENEQTAVQSSNLTAIGTQDSDDSVTTYSLAPRWRVSDDTMLYARVATGYRPGGPNVLSALGSGIIPPQYDSDKATNYELGIKTDLFDGDAPSRRGGVLHRLGGHPAPGHATGGQSPAMAMAGTAESQGVEWAATWLPSDRLTIRGPAPTPRRS